MKNKIQRECPVMNALSLIGGKWKLVIMHLLADKSMRFGELRRGIGDITQQMLSKQLKEMERDGLVRRKVFEVVPPHVEYSLTSFGRSGMPIIKSLVNWGTKKQRSITRALEK